MKSLHHTSLSTAHSDRKPSTFMSSSTHCFPVFLFPLTSHLYHLHLSTGRCPIIHTATLYTIFYIYNLSSPAVCRVSNLCALCTYKSQRTDPCRTSEITVVAWEDEPLNRSNSVRPVRYAKISNQELFLRFSNECRRQIRRIPAKLFCPHQQPDRHWIKP